MTILLALLLFAQPGARQHLERGFALAQSGDLKGAEAELREAVKGAPNDAQALSILGIVLSQQGQTAEANPFLERSMKLNPADVTTRYNLALNQARLGDTAPAIKNLERILQQAPGHEPSAALLERLRPRSSYDAALTEYAARRYAASRAILMEAIAGAPDPNLYRLLAWCHHREGHAEEARQTIARALELAPADADLYVNAAQLLHEQGDAEAARAAVLKAQELAPLNLAAVKLRGTLEAQRGDLKQALNCFERAADAAPGDAGALEGLATTRRLLFQYAESRALFDKAMAKFPGNARLLSAYAALLSDPGNPAADPARAAALLNKALTIDTSLADAHFQLGKLLAGGGKPAAALPHLEAAVELQASNRAAHLALANAYRALGRTADQARELQRYHDLGAR